MQKGKMKIDKKEWTCKDLIEEQKKDLLWSQVRAWIENPQLEFPREVRMPRENFVIEDDILYLIMPENEDKRACVRTVIPHSFVEKAMYLTHASPVAGHMGVDENVPF